MGGLILLRPWWLIALLPVLMLMLWAGRRAPEAGGWQDVMPPPMLTAMLALGGISGTQPRWHRALVPLASVALVLGLAGPALPRGDMPALARTDAVVLAMDLSPSVAQGSALTQAQLAAASLLQGLGGRPVGLILYGPEAYVASAPTTDPRTLETLIAVLDAETVPGKGSRPAAALGLTSSLLSDPRHADLVLISDGGGVDRQALAEAGRLSEAGTRIWPLRVEGAPAGATPAAPDALAPLALGGGQMMQADQADRLAARLAQGGDSRRDPALEALAHRDLGPFFAALAALPLLLMMRVRA